MSARYVVELPSSSSQAAADESLPPIRGGNPVVRDLKLTTLGRSDAGPQNGPLPPCNAPFSLLRPHSCLPVLDSPPSPTSERSITPPRGTHASASVAIPPPRSELFPVPSSSTLPHALAAAAQRERDETSSAGSGASAVGKGKRKASNQTDGVAGAGGPADGPQPGSSLKEGGGKNGKRARLEASDAEPSSSKAAAAAAAKEKEKDKEKGLLPLPSFSRKSGKPPTPSGSNRSSPSLPTVGLPPLPPSSRPKTATSTSASTSPETRSKPLPAGSSTGSGSTAAKKKKKASPNSSATPPFSAVRVSSATPRETGLDYSNRIGSIAEIKADDIVHLAGEHTGEVFVCAWNPDGKGKVATGAGDATVRLWEFKPPTGPGAGGKWELESDPLVCKHLPVTDRKDITSIVFTPTGTLLASASYDGIARLWTPQGELHGVLTRHSGPIFSLKFNPKGSLLATAGSDGSVCVWDAVSARLVKAWEFHSGASLSFPSPIAEHRESLPLTAPPQSPAPRLRPRRRLDGQRDAGLGRQGQDDPGLPDRPFDPDPDVPRPRG